MAQPQRVSTHPAAHHPAGYPAPHAVWSRPDDKRAGTPLVVLLHGYGANEADLMGLVPLLPEEFTAVSLRAPQTLGPGAYQWFPLMASDDFDIAQVEAAGDYVLAWLDGVRAQHSSVTLLGFSMGMAMATTLLRRRPREFAAVVGLSGFAIDPGARGWDYVQDGELDGTVPFFWGRDQADPVITQDKIAYTLGWVRERVDLTKIVYDGIMHSISAPEMAHVAEFLTYKVLSND
ncbi:alpha/beta fold hydrolase [Sinomonas sp. ASV322]|uniref:alpha/beta hydrolase n=1 Tax=Sinomonas sp. ASV322 TaxID=3041920 RepID=UPI0027DE8F0E|nr:alpha/beta fold hydrolase [Sinomonas sp. ASV322]MDQ4502795.1 phospholipase [Sinomonas sp. ASV322]